MDILSHTQKKISIALPDLDDWGAMYALNTELIDDKYAYSSMEYRPNAEN